MLTSLSPRCHPACAGLRRDWPRLKLHSSTSAIHKRQPLTSSPRPPPTSSTSTAGLFLLCHLSRPCTVLLPSCFFFFQFCPSKHWLFPYSCSLEPHALYLVPTEKFLTHYILNWKPAECGGCELGAAGRSSSKPPALTPSDIPMAQSWPSTITLCMKYPNYISPVWFFVARHALPSLIAQ